MKTKEIGLLFTPDNRSLTRANLKTETRRIAKPLCSVSGPHIEFNDGEPYPWYIRRRDAAWDSFRSADELADHHSPYGGKGNPVRYYVKEPVQVLDIIDGAILNAAIRYQDDGAEAQVILTPGDYHKLMAQKDWRRPSTGLFMFKSFARTWLKRERLWVEKLGEMSEPSCINEGIELNPALGVSPTDTEAMVRWAYSYAWRDYLNGGYDLMAQQSYASLWNSINGAGSWNPEQWVWCIKYSKED